MVPSEDPLKITLAKAIGSLLTSNICPPTLVWECKIGANRRNNMPVNKFLILKTSLARYANEVYITYKSDFYLYNTFFTALTTSSELGSHSLNNTGEYGAGVSAVFIFTTGASR